MTFYSRHVKRILDVIVSGLALVLLSPVLLAAAALVWARVGRPVLFVQQRPGHREKLFLLYKFRTMTDARDKKGCLLPDIERITPTGAWLRKTSIDELPELWNILRGDMSLVGPRPLLTTYLPYYTEAERHRHDVRPGLSGLAQISGRNSLDWDARLAKDLEYVSRITLAGDVRIILLTLLKVFRRENVIVNTDAGEGNLARIRQEKIDRLKTGS